MTKIDERKNIIVSLKSNYGERKKGIDKRIQYLKGMTILDLVLTTFCGGIVLLSIILEPLGYEFFKWQKMGLLTILSLSFILRLPEEIFELKLLKHLRNISDKSDFLGIDKLNSDLKIIVDKLNKKLKYNRLIIPLAIIILVFIQVLSENLNPYWNYAKIPVLLFFGMIVIRFYNVNKKLNKNIMETEKYCS
jgi:DMSO reductase anchor subunit